MLAVWSYLLLEYNLKSQGFTLLAVIFISSIYMAYCYDSVIFVEALHDDLLSLETSKFKSVYWTLLDGYCTVTLVRFESRSLRL